MSITAQDIAAALTAADIDYTLTGRGTDVEAYIVTRPDGRTAAFGDATTETGEAADGVAVTYYAQGVDSDISSQDHLTIPAEIEDLVAFLSRK